MPYSKNEEKNKIALSLRDLHDHADSSKEIRAPGTFNLQFRHSLPESSVCSNYAWV